MGAYVSKGSVAVSGLGELRQAMKEMADPKSIQRALKDTHYEVSKKVLVRAQAIAAASGNRGMVIAAGTLKARKTEANAQISLGSDDVPSALGMEFGAYHDVIRRNGRKGYNQFPLYKGRGRGYFLMPAIAEVGTGKIGEEYLTSLSTLIDKHMK